MDNRKYRIDTDENRAFLESLSQDLLNFGRRFPSPGGSAYYLGDDGTPWTDRPREAFITCRMAHVYSIGSFLGDEGSGELVDAALKGLREELRDYEHGGWYSGITADGGVLPGKLCYAHAFVILAATSALLARREGAGLLLEQALADYDRFFWNEEDGLSCDNWDTEFKERSPYRGLNANMHTVEAFLSVWDVTGDETYLTRCHRMIDHVVSWAKETHWRIPEHFNEEWVPIHELNKDRPADPFKPYGATPGHGIEWSRLIAQFALAQYGEEDALQSGYIEAAEQLFLRAVQDAWNVDGAPGLVYTTNWEGEPVVHDRMHWVLAEAINTSATLYRITGKQVYADYYAQFMEYLDDKVLDHENGSWFHQMDRDNHVIGTVWPGKNDLYHAFQATLIPYYKPGVSIALAVKKQLRK